MDGAVGGPAAAAAARWGLGPRGAPRSAQGVRFCSGGCGQPDAGARGGSCSSSELWVDPVAGSEAISDPDSIAIRIRGDCDPRRLRLRFDSDGAPIGRCRSWSSPATLWRPWRSATAGLWRRSIDDDDDGDAHDDDDENELQVARLRPQLAHNLQQLQAAHLQISLLEAEVSASNVEKDELTKHIAKLTCSTSWMLDDEAPDEQQPGVSSAQGATEPPLQRRA